MRNSHISFLVLQQAGQQIDFGVDEAALHVGVDPARCPWCLHTFWNRPGTSKQSGRYFEGSCQDGTANRTLVLCELDVVSDDDVSTRHVDRVTASYPDCPRQWYRLSAEPHQSPIRIKVQERSTTVIHSGHRAPSFPQPPVLDHLHAR